MNERKEEKVVYITKYWATKGISRVTAKWDPESPKMVSYKLPGCYMQYDHGADWHLTEEEAQARVQECVAKKVASMEKKLSKFKAMAGKPVKVTIEQCEGNENGK